MKDWRTTHGHSRRGQWSPEYQSWIHMRQRCNNPLTDGYRRYGGRSIKICERWERFENFLADMGQRPSETSLERINNDGNYEPGNCVWGTAKEQARNRVDTVFVEWAGRKLCLKDWARVFGMTYHSLWLHWKRGKTIDQIANFAARR